MRNVLILLLITFGILFHSSVMSSVTGNLSEGLESEKKPAQKRILAIFGFKQAMPFGYYTAESMRETLTSEAPFPIELNIEFADLARYPDETYLAKIVDFYRFKYSKDKFDLVLAIGDETAKMMVEYGDELFGDIPIVIIGSGLDFLAKESKNSNTFFLKWGWDIGKTLEIIQDLLPKTQHLYFISGATISDLSIRNVALEDLSNTRVNFKTTFITDFTATEMLEKIAHLPNNSVIFFLSVIRDINNVGFISRDLMHEVSEKANMPTFGMSDTYLGHGIVGGKLLSPAYQGRRLIRTALKILNDEPIKNTGSLKGDNQVMFDWRQLKRWSINEKDLPPNSVVKYKEHSIWDAHKGKIIGAISIILSQGLAVIFLLIQRKRRSHAESESRSLRDDLAHISRVMSMGEMATSLAHEVNQPLTAIQSYAQAAQRFLQRQPPEYKEVSNSLEGVVEGSRRAKQVIQRIRMTLDKEPSQRSTNKVRDLINGVLLLVQGNINEKKIHLKLDIENGLPKVICDQVQLQQVLLNLIINGIDAICEKSVEVRELTVLAYQEQDENVVISVKDSGVGIDENILKQPFDAFYTTKKEGLGVGLSISKSIIEDHGGRLWITKNQDRGVTVSFTVPVSKENLR
ncbi:ATP-binding protein [Crocinitomicaceae bacterium]|nr:ATP-binding protein [Crocinitomicaceae bacterium]